MQASVPVLTWQGGAPARAEPRGPRGRAWCVWEEVGGTGRGLGWWGGLAFLLLTRHPASSGASSLHVLSSQSLGRVDESAIPI